MQSSLIAKITISQVDITFHIKFLLSRVPDQTKLHKYSSCYTGGY